MTDRLPLKPSPEVKAILLDFCRVNEAKYGPDWKAILARELTDDMVKNVPWLFKGPTNVPGKYPEHLETTDKGETGGTEKPSKIT